jgi:hypothetical protein
MRDRIAVLPGILVLILGLSVYLTPKEYRVQVEFLPMALVGIMVLALGAVLVIVGLISTAVERLQP